MRDIQFTSQQGARSHRVGAKRERQECTHDGCDDDGDDVKWTLIHEVMDFKVRLGFLLAFLSFRPCSGSWCVVGLRSSAWSFWRSGTFLSIVYEFFVFGLCLRRLSSCLLLAMRDVRVQCLRVLSFPLVGTVPLGLEFLLFSGGEFCARSSWQSS